MGMIRVLNNDNRILVELDPEELIHERFAVAEGDNLLLGSIIGGIAFLKIQARRPAIDPLDVASCETGFSQGKYIVTLNMKGNWHEKIKG